MRINVISLAIAAILMIGCGRTTKKSNIHLDHSPSWGVKNEATSEQYIREEKTMEPERLDYKPKATDCIS